MKHTFRLVSVALCAAAFAFACSDDDKPGGKDAGDDGGDTGGSKATGGKGGAGTGGSKGGSGGAGTGGSKGGSGGTGTGGSKGGTTGTGGAKPDGGPDASSGGSEPTDGGDGGALVQSICGGKSGAALTECGGYIVLHVAACVDCHTPRTQQGLDTSKLLAGNPSFADLDPNDPAKGNLPAPNLTQLKAKGWTASDVKDAVLNGNRSVARGGGMFPAMPYFTLHNLAPIDADAVAAYILSLTPITNAIDARQPLPAPFDQVPLPAPPIDITDVPESTLPTGDANRAQADYGRYLAAAAGPCMECHTERTPQGALDKTKFFAGGESFVIGGPFGTVVSANITPAKNGIQGYTPADVQKVIKQGVNKGGKGICPPMPVGPNGAFGQMTDADALAIGRFVTTIPPIVNPEGDGGGHHPVCTPPGPPAP